MVKFYIRKVLLVKGNKQLKRHGKSREICVLTFLSCVCPRKLTLETLQINLTKDLDGGPILDFCQND